MDKELPSTRLKSNHLSRNIQEYINGLINKQRIFYLDLNNNTHKKPEHACPTCSQKLKGGLSCDNQDKQLDGKITDLKEFTNLKGINVSNNQFTNLDFLDTLPNKDKEQKIRVFSFKGTILMNLLEYAQKY